MPGRTIRVIELGEQPALHVHELLKKLGHEPSLAYPDDWSACDERLPALILFGSGSYSIDPIVKVLNDRLCSPVMAVFCGREVDDCKKILSAVRDFVLWPCKEAEFAIRLERICSPSLQQGPSNCTEVIPSAPFGMIGSSVPFVRNLRLIHKFAMCDAPLLIVGETGTGKEVAARAVHYLGERREFPFIPVNCGALPDQLIENELFGHDSGAYTDARQSQPGVIDRAQKGTLFLDEIANLSLRGQCAILRFLETLEYRRLGGQELRHADVRIIAATNANLESFVATGGFRADLLFRLNILTIDIPPLRDREGDVKAIAEHILGKLRKRYGKGPVRFTTRSLDWMARYRWPGNIREMENMLHRAFLLSDDLMLDLRRNEETAVEASQANDECNRPVTNFRRAKADVIQEFERDYLTELLRSTGGNVSQAARIAGKERRALGKLMKKHGIDRHACLHSSVSP